MNKKNLFIVLSIILVSFVGIFQYKKMKSQESSIPSLSFTDEELKITSPYAFATASNAKTGAAFMMIENTGTQKDRLISVRSDVAEITEIHENFIDPDDGTMMMRKINGLDIPQDSMVMLKPKGYHVMLINLKSPLKMNDSFPLTLVFEKSGEQIINVNVVAPGINPHSHH